MSINLRSFCSSMFKCLISLLILVAALWGGLALYYQLPLPMPWLSLALLFWAAISISALGILWRNSVLRGALLYLAVHATLLLWWSSLTPSNQHQWQDDVAQMTSGTERVTRSPCLMCVTLTGALKLTTPHVGKHATTTSINCSQWIC